MPSRDDVARICLALPATSEVTSRGNRQWRVRDKLLAWERHARRDRCSPPRAPRALVAEHLPLSSGGEDGLPS